MADDESLPDTKIVDVSDSFDRNEVEALIGKTVAGKYKITRRLARGGMGVVYLAEHAALGRPVVFKVLSYHLADDNKAKTRFEREARGLSVLDHPNVVTVHDFGYERGLTYIVMEYVHGENLSQRVRQEGRIPYDDLLPIMLQTIDAIGAAHEKKIVHRDIKPSNIMTTQKAGRDDFVKVLDFGLAKLAHTSVDLTKGNLVGSVSYLAPEVIKGAEATPASDVYSLGVMFYYLLAGQKPFQASDDMSVLYQHVNDQPDRLRHLVPEGEAPEVFLEFIHRCMSKEPEKRPTDAGEMRLVLEELVSLPRISAFSIDSSSALPRLQPPDSSAQQIRPPRRTPASAGRAPAPADASQGSISLARPNRWVRIGVVAFTTFSIGLVAFVLLKEPAPESTEPAGPAPPEKPVKTAPKDVTTSVLKVHATPAGEVTIDGKSYGESPAEAELEPGPHQVNVTAPGYQSWTQTVNIEPAERRTMDVFLMSDGSEERPRDKTRVTTVNEPEKDRDRDTPPPVEPAENQDAGTADAGPATVEMLKPAEPDETEAEKDDGLLSVDEEPGALLPVD